MNSVSLLLQTRTRAFVQFVVDLKVTAVDSLHISLNYIVSSARTINGLLDTALDIYNFWSFIRNFKRQLLRCTNYLQRHLGRLSGPEFIDIDRSLNYDNQELK